MQQLCGSVLQQLCGSVLQQLWVSVQQLWVSVQQLWISVQQLCGDSVQQLIQSCGAHQCRVRHCPGMSVALGGVPLCRVDFVHGAVRPNAGGPLGTHVLDHE